MDAIPSAKVIRASCYNWQISQKKLRSIAEIEGYIVDIPNEKEMLHPARFFEDLYLQKLRAQGLSNNDLSKWLDLSVEQLGDFLIRENQRNTYFG